MDIGAVIAALGGFIAGIWDWQTIFESIPALLKGLVRTFELVGISLALGFVLAVPLLITAPLFRLREPVVMDT